MKKLSKMVMLLASALVMAVFAGCSNGSSSGSDDRIEATWEPATILATRKMVMLTEGNGKWTYAFEADGKHLTMTHTKTDHDFYGGADTFTYEYRITSDKEGYIKGNGKEYTFTYELMGDMGYLIKGISIFENNHQTGYFAQ